MKSKEITVWNDGTGIVTALAVTDELANANGLNKKKTLHLRLLCEELMGMMRAVAGEMKAVYSVENEDNVYKLTLSANTEMYITKRQEFIALSTEGKNSAAKGFMGKLRDVFEIALSKDDRTDTFSSFGMMGMSSPGAYRATQEVMAWSLSDYRSELSKGDEWDELERSIVASIADNVEVFIKGDNVTIVITKAMDE
ncbi:MAG: hypothetical protein K6D02_02900 [Lachnospiraceae bacterium]|nr:hypothetical protein [Lachnospiraceae bacterium]